MTESGRDIPSRESCPGLHKLVWARHGFCIVQDGNKVCYLAWDVDERKRVPLHEKKKKKRGRQGAGHAMADAKNSYNSRCTELDGGHTGPSRQATFVDGGRD